MKRKLCLGVALATGCVGFNAATAAELHWSGFGSIVGGVAVHQEDLAGGADSVFKANPTLDGFSDGYYDDSINFRPDSNIGLQATADLGDGLVATTQLVAKGANNFEVDAEWAYVSYEFSDNFTGMIGRQRTPFYFYSDYIDVSYAYHWLRQPMELYGEGISRYEGISGFYTGNAGDWDYEIQGYFGSGNNEHTETGHVYLEDAGGLVFRITNGEWSYRASVHGAEGWLDYSDTFVGSELMGEEDPTHFRFYSLGANYDRGDYFALVEVTLLTADEFAQIDSAGGPTFDTRESWMMSAGYRINEFTPHITFSSRETEFTADAGGPAAGLADKTKATQTVNVGVRWDFHPSAAFKVDYTHVTDESDDEFLTNGKVGEVSVLAAGVDFVF